jgi:hypothetical protein
LRDAACDVAALYGEARVKLVLALEIRADETGARWGSANLAWAASFELSPEAVAERGYDIETAHRVNLNGFTNIVNSEERARLPPPAPPKAARQTDGAVPAAESETASVPKPQASGARAAISRVLRVRAQDADDPPGGQASDDASEPMFLSNHDKGEI